jgi:hypothetical protein
MKVSNKSMTCKLTTPELQARKKTVISQLKDLVVERVELDNGVRYKFVVSDETVELVTNFIKMERLCCDFFDFRMDVGSNGDLFLELSGPDGSKEFIVTELTF